MNDLDLALEEIQVIEKRGLLNHPPVHISAVAKREIALGQNSTTLRAYINETKANLNNTGVFLYVFYYFFFQRFSGFIAEEN